MTDLFYGWAKFVLLIGFASSFIALALLRLRISMLVSGIHEFSVGSIRSNADTSFEQGKQRRDRFRDARALALVPGSDIDPALRTLFLRERWLNRAGWSFLAALLVSMVLIPTGGPS